MIIDSNEQQRAAAVMTMMGKDREAFLINFHVTITLHASHRSRLRAQSHSSGQQ